MEKVPACVDANMQAMSAPPAIDVWPLPYATSYELQDGGAPLPPDDPGFQACSRAVGDFPEVNLSLKMIYTRVLTAFGSGLIPFL